MTKGKNIITRLSCLKINNINNRALNYLKGYDIIYEKLYVQR